MPDRSHFLWVPLQIWILSKGPQKPILGTIILGCATISIPVNYHHLQNLILGTAIFGWIWYGYIFYHSICALFVAILKKVYNNWLWVQLFLADHNVDTSILMQYVHYLIRFLKRSTNTGFGYREVHMNVCSGYITVRAGIWVTSSTLKKYNLSGR